MQYFEQVHRGIRAPGRALAPAICAVALCTAVLMVAAWPTMAEADDYFIRIYNFPETGESIQIRRVSFKFTDSTYVKVYKGSHQRTNNDNKDRYWSRKHSIAGYGKHKFKVKWKCLSKSTWNEKKSNGTSWHRTHLVIKGCSNSDISQTNDKLQ